MSALLGKPKALSLLFPHCGRPTTIENDRTDSQPRARWYPLRGLPLVDSECVCPQCNSYFVITRGSAMPAAFGLPVHRSRVESQREKVHLPSQVKSPTVKCPMVLPQRYSTVQRPISGYQPQVGSNRLASIKLALRRLGNDHVQQIVVTLITTCDLSRILTVQYDLQQPHPHRSNFKQPRTTSRTFHCACNLPKNRPHAECVLSYNSHQ